MEEEGPERCLFGAGEDSLARSPCDHTSQDTELSPREPAKRRRLSSSQDDPRTMWGAGAGFLKRGVVRGRVRLAPRQVVAGRNHITRTSAAQHHGMKAMDPI